MTQEFESHDYLTGAPASIFISKVSSLPSHTHEVYELFLMLEGRIEITINNEIFTLEEDDIILINRLALHSYRPVSPDENCLHAVCQIDIRKLMNTDGNTLPVFSLNSTVQPDENKYTRLRALIARLISAQTLNDQNALSTGILYEILSELMLHFSHPDSPRLLRQDSKYQERREALINYIAENYRNNLTLNSVAEAFNLSVPYLSAFFKKQIGVTFTEYYNIFRLEHATNEMLLLDDTIESIAYRNGFSDTRTFVRLFREKYNQLPSAYRKEARKNRIFPDVVSRGGNLFHPSVPKSFYEVKLNDYLEQSHTDNENISTQLRTVPDKHMICKPVSLNPTDTVIKKTDLRKVCFVESYTELMQANVQEMLRDLQKKIGFEYISFNLLSYFCRNMYGCETYTGNRDFYFLDHILDFLISIRLKPLLTLKLNYVEDRADMERLQLALPDDTEALCRHLNEFADHIVNRYGIGTVSDWIFRIWFTCPCENTVIENVEEFFLFYQKVFNAVKSVSLKLTIGSHPALLGSDKEYEMSRKFVRFCAERCCLPDHFNFAYSKRSYHVQNGKLYPNSITESELQELFDRIENFKTDLRISDIPSWLFEYDMLIAHDNPMNDTCYKSCHTMYNIARNLARTNMEGFWKLTDYSSIRPFPSSLFHGGTALYTYNGIAKPYFHVFSFLNRLGKEILALESGYLVTRDSEHRRICVLFYNHDFDPDAADRKNSHSLSPFYEKTTTSFSLKLDQIDGDFYSMKQFSIGISHGSSYDTWMKLGSPQNISESSMDFIRNVRTDLLAESDRINNGIINIEVNLEPLEIRLVELEIR